MLCSNILVCGYIHTERTALGPLMLMDKTLAQFQPDTHGHPLQHGLENRQLVWRMQG